MENQLNRLGVRVAGTMLRVTSLYRVASKYPLNPCMTQSRDTAKESLAKRSLSMGLLWLGWQKVKQGCGSASQLWFIWYTA